MLRRPPRATLTDTLFPYPTLFRSDLVRHRLELSGPGAAAHEIQHPALHPVQAGIAAGRKGAHQVQRRRRLVIGADHAACVGRSEEHTSELQSLMRHSYAVLCLKKNTYTTRITQPHRRA